MESFKTKSYRLVYMRKIIFVIGLPGSGKTIWAQNYIKEHPEYTLVDDPKLLDQIPREGNLIIVDPMLCRKETLDHAIKLLDSDYECIYFENNPENCLWNAHRRQEKEPHKYVDPTIQRLTKIYKIPEGVKPIKVIKY